ncbi:MAG: GNAT family protein [Bacteroidota bacterium]
MIITERLHLREVTYHDLSFIHELNSIPEVDQYNTLGIPETITVTEQYTNEIILAQKVKPRVRYIYIMEDNTNQQALGMIGLTMGKPHYRNAEVWYKINPAFWNKGYASEALKAILVFGFNTLQLHRIEAGCAIENIASVKVLEKAGFTKEAHTRKLLPIRGKWHDNFGFAILEEDFFKE